MRLELWIYWYGLFIFRKIRHFARLEIFTRRLLFIRFYIMLFHKFFFIIICKLSIIFHLKILPWSIRISWKFWSTRLIRLLRMSLFLISKHLVSRLNFRKMKSWFRFCRSGITLYLISNILHSFSYSFLYIIKITQNPFDTFMLYSKSILYLYFDMNN